MALKKEGIQGVKFVGVATLLTNFFQLVQLITVARILSPSELGLMGMAMIIIGLAFVMVDMGIGSAVIQRREISVEALSTLYWLSFLFGGLVCLALLALKGVFANLFDEPRLDEIIGWASLSLIIAPIGQQYRALLEKDLQFKRVVIVEITATAIGVMLTITLALLGKGVFALVWGWLTTVSITALALMLVGVRLWRPSRIFKISTVSGYLRFGLNLVGQRSVNYTTSNIDFLAIGVLFGAQALGYYALAYNLANLASSRVNYVLARVFFPVFSRTQDDSEGIKAGYLKMQEYSGIVNVLLLVGLATTAPLLIVMVFGAQWQSSIVLLQVLCIVGLLRSIVGTVGPLLLAKGRADLGFKWSLLVVILQVPSIFLGAKLGASLGVAIAFALLQVLLLALNYQILIRVLLGPCLKQYIDSIWPSLAMGLVLAISMLGAGEALRHISSHWLLVLQISIGLITYGLLTWFFKRSFLVDLGQMFYTKKNTQ